jgi:hypothetical protein
VDEPPRRTDAPRTRAKIEVDIVKPGTKSTSHHHQ